METKVVNLRSTKYDKYIGRTQDGSMHFGNPFTHKEGTRASIIVKNVEESVEEFRKWITGEDHNKLDQKRRQWILEHMEDLVGKNLGCFCAPHHDCHGCVYLDLIEKKHGGTRTDKFTLIHKKGLKQ